MTENTDLRKLLETHSNKWIALSSDSHKVVGVADNPKDAIEQARINKEPNPVLTRMPKHYGTFVL